MLEYVLAILLIYYDIDREMIFIDANVFCKLGIDFNIEDVIVLENVLQRKQKYTRHPIILNQIFCHLPQYTYSHLYS